MFSFFPETPFSTTMSVWQDDFYWFWYGIRDAALFWEEPSAEHLTECGFFRGVSSPRVYDHEPRGIRTLVHSDGYVSTGAAFDLRWLRERLENKLEM